MNYKELEIPGVWMNTPEVWSDNRGHFFEVFKRSHLLSKTTYDFSVAQVNQSQSMKGVLRGIHVTDGPAGQAKYVSCLQGEVLDIFVDLRKDSPTFAQWGTVILSSAQHNSILIPEGVGHGFLTLTDTATVNYLCSSEYVPENDKVITIYDSTIDLPLSVWCEQHDISEIIQSGKDKHAGPLSSKA